MTSDERASAPWSWPGSDPADWVKAWAGAWSGLQPGAPQNLTQPILGGWTVGPVLTINAANSRDPQTEADIVARHSYGRQLGRLTDAVSALIDQRPDDAPGDARLDAFTAMARDIDTVKIEAAADRATRFLADLALLENTRPDTHRRLRDALARAMDP
jgi:hypothetical protein